MKPEAIKKFIYKLHKDGYIIRRYKGKNTEYAINPDKKFIGPDTIKRQEYFKILNAIPHSEWITSRKIAEKTELPITSVRKYLKPMKEEHSIICKYIWEKPFDSSRKITLPYYRRLEEGMTPLH
jgi:transcription initiation factor IIE alpha subunit